jgi:Ca-activated chloride channel family protein
MNHWKICFIVAALAATPTTSIVFAEDDVSPAATLRANAQALLTKPDARAESVYNAGVNMYRAGEFELAGELFAAAASNAKAMIAARSMYNRGTTSYAQSLKSMQTAGENPQPAPDAQQAVIESLERSLRELKDAVRADPTNIDARANAELAYRVLKDLKKEQEKQQQKDEQKQDEEKKDEEKKDDEKKDDQKKDEEKKDGEKKDDQKKDGDKKDDQKKDGEKKDEKKQDQSKPSDDKPQDKPQDKQDSKPMTKQDVERLLQKIRDRERARILDKLEHERARTKPAPKDW